MPNSTDSQEPLLPPVAPIEDTLGLGRTPWQRRAEILAGLRAELTPSPVTRALSSFRGRVAAWIILRMMEKRAALNHITARPLAFAALAQQFLSEAKGDTTLISLLPGFSPLGLELALALPHTQVIEIDLPAIVEEKQARLQKVSDLTLPSNLTWQAVDLSAVPLTEALAGHAADVVMAKGLNPYLTPPLISRVAYQVKDGLKPNGIYISDVGWDATRHLAQQEAVRFFMRQVAALPGSVRDAEEARLLFADAGYCDVTVYRLSELASQHKLFTPVIDFSLIVVARRT